MKTVHPKDTIAHLWAHQSQGSARTPTDNFSFSGPTLYSYSTPIGFILPDAYGRAVLLSVYRYSNTTSKHQYLMRRAVHNVFSRVICIDVVDANAIRRVNQFGAGDICAALTTEAEDQLIRAIAPRIRQETRDAALSAAARSFEYIRFLAGVDANRRDINKVNRARARAILRKLPNASELADAHGDADKTKALVVKITRTRLKLDLQKAGAAVLSHARQFAKTLAALDETRTAGEAVREYTIQSAISSATLARNALAEAKHFVGLTGSRMPTGAQKAADAVAARLPELHAAMARVQREKYLAQWANAVASIGAEPASSRFYPGPALSIIAGHLADGDTDAEKAERKGIIDNAKALADDAAARDAVGNFDRLAATFHEFAQLAANGQQSAGHYGVMAGTLADMRRYVARSREPDTTALSARLAELTALYQNMAADFVRERVASWYAGDGPRYMPAILQLPDGQARLRLVGDKVETSQGADVPASVCPNLWQMVSAAKAEGRGYDWGAHGDNGPRLGVYRLTSVSATGDIIAGCHHIPYAELERIARALGYIA